MLPKYIEDWLWIIEGMRNNNTYKFAWGKAIIELCTSRDLQFNESVCFTFQEIGEVMLKYYWNQTFFFDLDQGPNKQKKPEILTYTKEAIAYYQQLSAKKNPIWFDEAKKVLQGNINFYMSLLKKISNTLKSDVCYRFIKVGNKDVTVYNLDKEHKQITLTYEQAYCLKEYSSILSQLFNYRWASLLEKFNHAPRIIAKVRGSSENVLRRPNLKKYEKILTRYMSQGVYDFYTGELLEISDISVDHVIPYSFNYDTRIWNLVITSKSNNSMKGNSIPSTDDIKRLKERNQQLYQVMEENERFDLEEAIENHYVDTLYHMMRY